MTAAKARLPSLSALSAIGSTSLQATNQAGPALLPIDKITEDTTQPRSHFDQAQLDELAASIRARGVLQPIGVVKSGEATYRIVFGARRYRAARMAALQVIPAVVLPEDRATLDVQMIENIHRSDLRNSELVAGIIRMAQEGKSRKDIAELLGWDPERVKRCQALEGAPAIILQVLDGGTAIRAAYDLFYAWKKAPQAIEAAIGDKTEMSYAEVRALIATALDKTPRQPEPAARTEAEPAAEAPSLPPALPEPAAEEESAPAEPDPATARPAGNRGTRAPVAPEPASAAGASEAEAARAAPIPAPSRRAPRFTVQAGAREGVLITNRASEADGHALVQFGEAVENVPVSELRLIAVAALP
jgi:ParB family transcriptional regulator, chromosome partitioning protein